MVNLRQILIELENNIDNNRKRLNENTDDALLKKMAAKHFEYEQKINDLYDQLSAIEEERDTNSEAIFAAVSKIKGKSIKFGKTLIKIQRTKSITKGKNATSWKSVVDEVRSVFEEESRIIKVIDSATQNNFRPAEDKINIDHDLIIKKESVEIKGLIRFIESKTGKKVVLQENIFAKISSAVISVYRKIFGSFSRKVDELDAKVSQMIAGSESSYSETSALRTRINTRYR